MSEPGSGQHAIFHITHWKAGSQWVLAILRDLAPDRFVSVKGPLAEVLAAASRDDGVYSPVYLPRHRFLEAVGARPHRRFVIIRDLRDTLVSWYFSLRFSHGENAFVADQRAQFESLSTEEALLSLVQGRLKHFAAIQSSWLLSGDPANDLVLRYEDLLADDLACFERILDHVQFRASPELRRRIIAEHRFENRTGRQRGQEQAASHHRKGVAGDWQNHFTPRLRDAFRQHFGQHLIDTGYESSLDW
jgi:hypothetical protein